MFFVLGNREKYIAADNSYFLSSKWSLDFFFVCSCSVVNQKNGAVN
jgi:hypothetical protein